MKMTKSRTAWIALIVAVLALVSPELASLVQGVLLQT